MSNKVNVLLLSLALFTGGCTLNIVKDSTNVTLPTTHEGSAKLSIADSNFGGEADSEDEVIPE